MSRSASRSLGFEHLVIQQCVFPCDQSVCQRVVMAGSETDIVEGIPESYE